MSWIMFFTFLQTYVYVCVDAQILSDKDVTKQVIHRLDELERQVKQQHVEIEALRRENVELKSLWKYDSDILREQIVELGRLRQANVQLGTEIESLKERDTQLVARIELLENRDKTMAELVKHPVPLNSENGATKINAEDDVEMGNHDKATIGKRGIVSDSQEKTDYNRIRRHSEAGQTIAFLVTRSNGNAEHLGVHQDVVFDKTVTNIGQGYHNTTGIFTAPVSGVYVFSTTLFTFNEGAHFHFVINGQAYTWMYAHSSETYETMSQTVIFNLAKGDDVAIQSADLDKMVHGADYSTFSGFLLVSTEDNVIVG